jgi:large conductance mechanosensitive channel
MWTEFKAFLTKTNALALAIGVIIGIALGNVVNSLVNDIIMPPIGLALGNLDFSNLKIVLKAATGGDPATEVAIRYGTFINVLITFVIVALVVWWISRSVIKEPEAAPEPEMKTCPYCKELVPADATKCRACTSQL